MPGEFRGVCLGGFKVKDFGIIKRGQKINIKQRINILSDKKLETYNHLFFDLREIIETGKQQIAQAVNIGLISTYWNIGKRINDEVLGNKRADYGKQIVNTLSMLLTEEYGKGWSAKQLRHCLRFAETFSDFQIVSALWRQLSWTHFKILMYLQTDLQIGLILCAEGNSEQIELLQLDKVNIKVAEYITKYLPKKLLAKKLHQFSNTAKKLIENRYKE